MKVNSGRGNSYCLGEGGNRVVEGKVARGLQQLPRRPEIQGDLNIPLSAFQTSQTFQTFQTFRSVRN